MEHMDGPFRALSEIGFQHNGSGACGGRDPPGVGESCGAREPVEGPERCEGLLPAEFPAWKGSRSSIGKWNVESSRSRVSAPLMERPNIFKLYEENIGPLTPLIADALKDAEETYSDEWIAETIELAVKNNKRSWKYCEAILKRWKEEGRHGKKDQQDPVKSSERYTKSEFAEYLEPE